MIQHPPLAPEAVSRRFPTAVPTAGYLAAVTTALHRASFTSETTLVALARCRDELTGPFARQVAALWGSTFDLPSLAGMPTAGVTALRAAAAHVPTVPRSAFVIMSFTHVGIDGDGTIGRTTRAGVPEAERNTTCGALGALLAAHRGGTLRTDPDPADFEQSALERRLGPLLDKRAEDGAPVADLADVAEVALGAMESGLDAVLDRLIPDRGDRPVGFDGGLFTGIHVHGIDGVDHIVPSRSIVETGGEADTIEL